MNLQLADKNLKKHFENVRKTVPRLLEFLTNKLFEFIVLYHHNRMDALVPINNAYMLLEVQKKFLNRVHTSDGLELFTEELSEDTIEQLKSKGATLKSLEKAGERSKMISKFKLSDEEAAILNQYYEGLPSFKLDGFNAYVKGHEGIEAGDVATVEFKIVLENNDNQLVVDNMLRKSFNYPNQEERILKTPYFYVLIMEKGGKVTNYQKVSFRRFAIPEETGKIRKSITVKSNIVFSAKGDKKLVIKVLNDTYFGVDKDLEKDFIGKLYKYTSINPLSLKMCLLILVYNY